MTANAAQARDFSRGHKSSESLGCVIVYLGEVKNEKERSGASFESVIDIQVDPCQSPQQPTCNEDPTTIAAYSKI